MTVAHSTLTGSDLHECKGAASATAGQVPVATGGGTAPFSTLSYTQISNTPALAAVATSGSYTDLTNKPLIPAYSLNGTAATTTPLVKTYTTTASAGVWTVTLSGFTTIHNIFATAINTGSTAATTAVTGVASFTTTSATGTVVLLANPPALGTTQAVRVTVLGV